MSECFVGHEMLNHLGRKIIVTQRSLRTLDMRNYLRRDRTSGLLQIKPSLFPVFKALEGGQRPNKVYREIGPDCSGAAVVVCKCKQCSGIESDIEHTRLSDEYHRQQVNDAVAAVKAKRH